jgi:hypothetical protein
VGVYRIMLVTSLIGVVAAQAWGDGTRSGRQPPL